MRESERKRDLIRKRIDWGGEEEEDVNDDDDDDDDDDGE